MAAQINCDINMDMYYQVWMLIVLAKLNDNLSKCVGNTGDG